MEIMGFMRAFNCWSSDVVHDESVDLTYCESEYVDHDEILSREKDVKFEKEQTIFGSGLKDFITHKIGDNKGSLPTFCASRRGDLDGSTKRHAFNNSSALTSRNKSKQSRGDEQPL